LGVGPGNGPIYVHRSADVEHAARSIVFSKTFDHSTICGAEQAIVVEPDVDLLRVEPAAVRGPLEAGHVRGPGAEGTETVGARSG
jgi:acyl-CoA reductase-like NAD-dependent aldehyde dehydrogenase